MSVEEYKEQKSRLYDLMDNLDAKFWWAKQRDDKDTMEKIQHEIAIQYRHIQKLTDLYVKESLAILEGK